MLTDDEILEIVVDAIERAEKNEVNWADYVDGALIRAGIDLAETQPDGSDPWEIVRLEDGRSVWLCDESAHEIYRYRIEPTKEA